MYQWLGRSCYRHPWRVLAAWMAVLVVVLVSIGSVGSAFDSTSEGLSSESRDGREILEEHFGGLGAGDRGSIVFLAEQGIEDPEVVAVMTALFDDVAEIEGVTLVSPYGPAGQRFVVQQGDLAGQLAYAEIRLAPDIDESESGDIGADIEGLIESVGVTTIEGLQVEVGGADLRGFDAPESEALGVGFAILILILALGSVVAMGTTVGVALVGVGVGAGLVVLLGNVIVMPDFSTTIGVMIGLGVGIDYALFIVTRYRESQRAGTEREAAVAVALDTSGRAVIFAGLTVVISLLGLLLIGLEFVAGLGIAAATTVTVVMAGSVTLLPAALGLVGERMDTTRWRGVVAAGLVAVALVGLGLGISPLLVGLPLAVIVLIAGSLPFARNPLARKLRPRKEKPPRETIWYRWSRVVQARPWAFALGGTAVLLFATLPVLGLRLGFSDESNYSTETTTRRAYDLLAEGFGPGSNGPLLIVTEVDSPDDLEVLADLSATLSEVEGVALVSPPQASPDGAAVLIQVQPTTAPQDEATESLVHELRDDVLPVALADTDLDPKVTGSVAAGIDFSAYLGERLPIFIGAVLGLSFLLLMAVFRSIVVPLKAVIMNLLSIGAAYGILVAVFQWGWLEGPTGIAPGPIEPFIPMITFAIVFGLSMDYEVFLLSRIKEEYDKTGDPVNSVADGLASTARVITTAAAIMVVVFGSFALEEGRIVKTVGAALALAVFIDATIVRMLIVPSTMELLGARNWWLPRWLDRIIPNLNVEGTYDEADSQ